MEKPLLSVIVPVYKVEEYLDECIRSIVSQTYENLELLLVDDGSPDRSGEICDAWAAKDSRVRVIHKENAGAGAARNAALDAAKGELIGFVDSDDYIAPKMYEHLYELMEPDVDIAECTVVTTEADDYPLDDGSGAEVRLYDAREAMKLHIRDEIFCQTPPNKLYRRSAIRQIRFPVGNLIDDEFFTYQVIGNARRLAHSSACMYAYRQQSGSAMHRPYSLRRLQGLDAKNQRLHYLQTHMPELTYEAKFDLFFTCLYMMQGSLSALKGEELALAKKKIKGIVARLIPLEPNPEASRLKNILMKMAQASFTGTAKLLNFLIRIHVLT